MTKILILKTAALGDVLRTTSILPGFRERFPDLSVTWVTAPAAVDLVRGHPMVERVVRFDVRATGEVGRVLEALGEPAWDWVLSFDDEEPLCELAGRVRSERLSGAHFGADGERTYTDDVAPWFDMGLLSKLGKEEADRLKLANTRTHPEIYASMLGVSVGKPILTVPPESRRVGEEFARRHELAGEVVGLNTGSGGRWHSKALPVERVVALVQDLHAARGGNTRFVLFGGPGEADRNRSILAGLEGKVSLADAGTDNGLLDFAALVSLCTVLLTSDSLAMHVGISQDVRIVAFFAPTPEAEIELYGLGEKLRSTAPDYASYRPDADTSTLTVERLRDALVRQLDQGR